MSDRHDQAERRRLERLASNPNVTEFEREDAKKRLALLLRGPECRFCLEPIKSHNGAQCPVLSRFQRRNGKEVSPTELQAEKIRLDMKREAEDRARGERKRDAKDRQGSLF